MDNAVALSALGVLATCVGLMAWVVKKVLGDVAPALDRHTQSAIGLQQAVEKNTENGDELLTFMKSLNGRLSKITKQTIDEQSVAHQTVISKE